MNKYPKEFDFLIKNSTIIDIRDLNDKRIKHESKETVRVTHNQSL